MHEITKNLSTLISILYSKLLDRPADEEGYRAIVNTVKDESSLFRVVTNFVNSREVKKRHLHTTSMAELYGEFITAHPDDIPVQDALRRVLSHYSGKKYLADLESFPKTSASSHYFGSIWLSKSADRIEGWLILNGRLDQLSVEVRIQDREPWSETLPVQGDAVFVDIVLEDALPDNCYMLFDENHSVISIGKNALFRDRLFCTEYFVATAGEIEADPFDHFLNEGMSRGMKFNPFSIPGLEEIRALDAHDLLDIRTLDRAFSLMGLLDAEYYARHAGLPLEEGVQHASGCVMRNEWIDFNPLLVRQDFRRHG